MNVLLVYMSRIDNGADKSRENFCSLHFTTCKYCVTSNLDLALTRNIDDDIYTQSRVSQYVNSSSQNFLIVFESQPFQCFVQNEKLGFEFSVLVGPISC
jgi:hypothetical protein